MEITQNNFQSTSVGTPSSTPSYFDPESENYLKELTRDELLEWLNISSSSDEGTCSSTTKNENSINESVDSESDSTSSDSDTSSSESETSFSSSSSSTSSSSDSDSESSTSEEEELSKERKVRFNLKPKIYLMRTWRTAHRLARQSYWEMVARDRYRFKRRINEIDRIVSFVLTSCHREKIYSERFSEDDYLLRLDVDDVEMLDLEKLNI